jgi:Na+/melibiose symporter-like transporter
MAVFLFMIEQSIALALSILPLALGGAGFLAKQFGQSQAATFTGKYAVAAQPTSLLADLIGEGMAGAFKQVPIYQVCQRQ